VTLDSLDLIALLKIVLSAAQITGFVEMESAIAIKDSTEVHASY